MEIWECTEYQTGRYQAADSLVRNITSDYKETFQHVGYIFGQAITIQEIFKTIEREVGSITTGA